MFTALHCIHSPAAQVTPHQAVRVLCLVLCTSVGPTVHGCELGCRFWGPTGHRVLTLLVGSLGEWPKVFRRGGLLAKVGIACRPHLVRVYSVAFTTTSRLHRHWFLPARPPSVTAYRCCLGNNTCPWRPARPVCARHRVLGPLAISNVMIVNSR